MCIGQSDLSMKKCETEYQPFGTFPSSLKGIRQHICKNKGIIIVIENNIRKCKKAKKQEDLQVKNDLT